MPATNNDASACQRAEGGHSFCRRWGGGIFRKQDHAAQKKKCIFCSQRVICYHRRPLWTCFPAQNRSKWARQICCLNGFTACCESHTCFFFPPALKTRFVCALSRRTVQVLHPQHLISELFLDATVHSSTKLSLHQLSSSFAAASWWFHGCFVEFWTSPFSDRAPLL